MTTSNTELAAQAREHAEWLDSLDLQTPARIKRAGSAADLLRQLADAVESKAEPVAYTVAGPVTNWARDFSAYRTQHYVRPVYAAPVQPEKDERKPLSDETIERLEAASVRPADGNGWGFLDRKAFARAIERAHGIGSSTEGGE